MTYKQSFKISPELKTLVRYLFGRQLSSFFSIFGRRGTGKTDFSLLLAEILVDLDLVRYVSTNVKIYRAPFPIQRIDNLEDLIFWGKTLKGRKLFILDEAGRSMPRRSPMSKLNVAIICELQIIRKYKMSMELVTPDPKYLDNNALGSDILDGVFKKPGFRVSKTVLYQDLLQMFELTVRNLPRTRIKFDTWDSAHFTLKRKPEDIKFSDPDLNYLWRYSQGSTVKELDIHPEQFRRLNRKYLEDSLKKHITPHKTQVEVSKPERESQF